MDKVLRCDCGFEVRSGDEARLVADARQHARDVHGMELTYEQVLAVAFRAQLNETAWQRQMGPGALETPHALAALTKRPERSD